MLDVRRLRVLCSVAEHGSLSAAAVALGYTQPAVSRQIATLEAEAGALLVRRVPAGIVLTDAGRLLVTRSEAILARLADAETELRALQDLEGGTLRLATFASAAASVLPIAVARFRRRYPAVELEIAMADPDVSLAGLLAGRFDLVLSHEPHSEDALPSTDCELVTLFEDPMYVAMAPDHPLAAAPRLALADFRDDPWMLATVQSCPDARLFLRSCHAAGFEPRIAFHNDDYSAILGFVAAGVGVGMIPDMVARGARDDVCIRSLDPAPPPRPITAALPARYRSPAAAAMLAVLQEVGEEWIGARLTLVGAESAPGSADVS
jgi:DNA-binding transcriptional LysR family regulator